MTFWSILRPGAPLEDSPPETDFDAALDSALARMKARSTKPKPL